MRPNQARNAYIGADRLPDLVLCHSVDVQLMEEYPSLNLSRVFIWASSREREPLRGSRQGLINGPMEQACHSINSLCQYYKEAFILQEEYFEKEIIEDGENCSRLLTMKIMQNPVGFLAWLIEGFVARHVFSGEVRLNAVSCCSWLSND